MTQGSESSRESAEGIALAAAGNVGRSMAALFTMTIQRYQDTLHDENLDFGDFILLNFLASTAHWREGLVEFLLNVTGDNPQRVVERALEHGWLVADSDGRLHATERVDELMGKLGQAAQEFNQRWRERMSTRFGAAELGGFLAMLQDVGRAPR
ncbi:MAG: hypothetical protein DWQ35_00830 [Planctomycetota bacterium]|nr:MAG: hypothetical protein DWQ35_00830 [Planctomycetota bacterium]REK29875.1 MAG: hypothetical protein DWQ42_02950 [Planctomycetota bacterium]REK47955.1 MAG: hypothetical protein DWQ46_03410 [Planctomycetota bacterium]